MKLKERNQADKSAILSARLLQLETAKGENLRRIADAVEQILAHLRQPPRMAGPAVRTAASYVGLGPNRERDYGTPARQATTSRKGGAKRR
jgi:hypothetical protein